VNTNTRQLFKHKYLHAACGITTEEGIELWSLCISTCSNCNQHEVLDSWSQSYDLQSTRSIGLVIAKLRFRCSLATAIFSMHVLYACTKCALVTCECYVLF